MIRKSFGAVVLPLLLICSILWPEFSKYYVYDDQVSSLMVNEVRQDTANQPFEELNQMRYTVLPVITGDAVAIADRIINENVIIDKPGNIWPISARFDPLDLGVGTPTFQLRISSGLIADIYHQAYLTSHEPDYLRAAVRYVVDFHRYEQSRWLPEYFMWNDHAISARILLMGRIWQSYVESPTYVDTNAKLMLERVKKDVALSRNEALYTYRTNHGLMQDLGSLHAAILFPAIIDKDRTVQSATKRLRDLLKYFVAPDGVVLEHSADYHQFGVLLMGYGLRYYELLNAELPQELAIRFPRAVAFYEKMKRPDGSLPYWGDTEYMSGPLEWAKLEPAHANKPWSGRFLSENFGVYINNEVGIGGASQLFIPWLNFVGQAHKHRDEMSVNYWSSGIDWWRGIGYWPYGVVGRKEAEGWHGNNAPHILAEHGNFDIKQTSLNFLVERENITYLQLSRPLDGGDPTHGVVTRQVICDCESWIVVVDTLDNQTKATLETVWTLDPSVRVGRLTDRSFSLRSAKHSQYMSIHFFSGMDSELHEIHGHDSSAMGWVALPTVIPTTTLVHETKNGWSTMISRLHDTTDPISATFEYTDVEHWKLTDPDEAMTVSREGMSLSMGSETFLLDAHESVKGENWNATVAAYELSRSLYANGKSYLPWRIAISRWLVVASVLGFVILILLVWFLRSRERPRLAARVNLTYTLGWIILGFWLHFVYFAP